MRKVYFGKFLQNDRAEVFYNNIVIGELVRVDSSEGAVDAYFARIWADRENPVKIGEQVRCLGQVIQSPIKAKWRLKVRIEDHLESL